MAVIRLCIAEDPLPERHRVFPRAYALKTTEKSLRRILTAKRQYIRTCLFSKQRTYQFPLQSPNLSPVNWFIKQNPVTYLAPPLPDML